MSRKTIFSEFLDFPIFTTQNLVATAERFGVSKNTLNSYIKTAVTKKELVVLKRGVYVTSDCFARQRSKQDYIFYIASKLLKPSYVSRESALQYYGLLTEANNTVITSVSTNTTRMFKNKLGIFDFRTVKGSLFTGYNNVKREFDFYIAEPHKAIFDYLYFHIPRKDFKEKDKVLYYLEEFRIDYEDVTPSELKKLFTLCLTI